MTDSTPAAPEDVEAIDVIGRRSKETHAQIDALNEELRTVLVGLALQNVVSQLGKLFQALPQVQGPSLGELANSLALAECFVNLAGYANEANREDHEEWTTTGDRRVSEILTGVPDMLREAAEAALPEGLRELLAEGGLTEDRVREFLDSHPDLKDRISIHGGGVEVEIGGDESQSFEDVSYGQYL